MLIVIGPSSSTMRRARLTKGVMMLCAVYFLWLHGQSLSHSVIQSSRLQEYDAKEATTDDDVGDKVKDGEQIDTQVKTYESGRKNRDSACRKKHVVYIKTYKTGSSTIANIMYR